MKNLLYYNYDIDLDNYNDIPNGINFFIGYDNYYFLKVKRNNSDLIEINKIIKSYKNGYHEIIPNKNNEIITKDKNENYILIRLKEASDNEYDLNDVIINQIPLRHDHINLNRSNWGVLWSEKVDYLEYQVSELGKNHKSILSSFSYYVGLAENAIEYYNMLEISNISLCLAQKRIFYPNIALNYMNPLNLIVDYRVRDIAEYIKSYFFNDKFEINDLKSIIEKNRLTPLECNLLYARLLYPSYYFDNISNILENKESDDIILKYTDKTNEYEKLLKDIYDVLSSKYEIIRIDWLIKK